MDSHGETCQMFGFGGNISDVSDVQKFCRHGEGGTSGHTLKPRQGTGPLVRRLAEERRRLPEREQHEGEMEKRRLVRKQMFIKKVKGLKAEALPDSSI